jgi:hypothetical protein
MAVARQRVGIPRTTGPRFPQFHPLVVSRSPSAVGTGRELLRYRGTVDPSHERPPISGETGASIVGHGRWARSDQWRRVL